LLCALGVTTRALFVGLALAALLRSSALAQASVVKPQFLIIADTSGSMSDAAPANSCGYVRTPGNPTRIDGVACVVRNLLDSVGDAVFGLETFRLTCSDATPTNPYSRGPGSGCGVDDCVYLPNETLPAPWTSGGGFPFRFYGCRDGGQLQVPLSTARAYELRAWGDGVFGGCTAAVAPGQLGGNDFTRVHTNPQSNTPLSGSLRTAYRYLNHEFAGSGLPSPYIDFDGTGQPDPYPACRPFNIILLSDGDEFCGSARPASSARANAQNLGCLRLDLNRDGDTTDPGEFNRGGS
jgi:hypothetical protein